MSVEARARRLALTQALMEDIGLKRESRLDDKGKVVDPGLYWKALHELWEYLGPEGRAELDRQAGIDSFGNVIQTSERDADVISEASGGQPETSGSGEGQGPLRDMRDEGTPAGEQALRQLPGECPEEQGPVES